MGPLFPADPSKRKSFVSTTHETPALVPGTEEKFFEAKVPADLAAGSVNATASTKNKKFSFSYIHGFSASRQEISPVIEDVAKYFSAPAFFIRLTGHGVADNGETFAKSQSLDWMNDADRAIEKALVPGHDLVLVGMSFGGLLATFAALEHPEQVKALILISPLFELPDPRAQFISGPLGRIWAQFILGPYHDYATKNETHRRLTTSHYPTKVIPQLMDCVNYIKTVKFSKIKTPLLLFYTENDKVVSVDAIKRRFNEFGSSQKFLVEVPGATDHILTGQMIEASTTDFVEHKIENFLENL